jgi:hypothetical protein
MKKKKKKNQSSGFVWGWDVSTILSCGRNSGTRPSEHEINQETPPWFRMQFPLSEGDGGL